MSQQTCHCGWSKVTTYHGLRVHQGRRGCTPRGVKVEPQQQYMWGYVGLTNAQVDVKVDVRTSVTHGGFKKRIKHAMFKIISS